MGVYRHQPLLHPRMKRGVHRVALGIEKGICAVYKEPQEEEIVVVKNGLQIEPLQHGYLGNVMFQMEISRCDAVLKIQRVFRGHMVRNRVVQSLVREQVVLEVLDMELAKVNHGECNDEDGGEQDDDDIREKEEDVIKRFQQIEHQHKKSTNKTFTIAEPQAQPISPNDEIAQLQNTLLNLHPCFTLYKVQKILTILPSMHSIEYLLDFFDNDHHYLKCHQHLAQRYEFLEQMCSDRMVIKKLEELTQNRGLQKLYRLLQEVLLLADDHASEMSSSISNEEKVTMPTMERSMHKLRCNIDWNRRYYNIMHSLYRLDDNEDASQLQLYEQKFKYYLELNTLFENFRATCQHLAVTIIDEFWLEQDQKSNIRTTSVLSQNHSSPSTLIYEVRGITLRILLDHDGSFNYNHELCSKQGGHELKASRQFLRYADYTQESSAMFYYPLQCTVDYNGYRVLATANHIICKENDRDEDKQQQRELVLGTDDHGVHVHTANRLVNAEMQRIAECIHVVQHLVQGVEDLGCRTVFQAVDLRGYRMRSGHDSDDDMMVFGFENFWRCLPCEHPDATPHLMKAAR